MSARETIAACATAPDLAARAVAAGPAPGSRPACRYRRRPGFASGSGTRTKGSARLLADLPQGGGDGGPQAAGAGGGEVGDRPRAGSALVLEHQLDADVVAAVAVVEDGDGPHRPGLVVVVLGVVVEGEVDRLLHRATAARSCTARTRTGTPSRGCMP